MVVGQTFDLLVDVVDLLVYFAFALVDSRSSSARLEFEPMVPFGLVVVGLVGERRDSKRAVGRSLNR